MNIVKLQDIKLTQQSLAFLYTNNEKTEGEIKETIPFTIAMKRIKYFSSVQLLSHVQLFATLWTSVFQASLSITNSRSLLKLMAIEWVTLSNHLILCHLLILLPSIFPSIRVLSKESVLYNRWAKYWSFSFSWKKKSSSTWKKGNSVLGNFCNAWQRGDYRHRCDTHY